MSNFSEKSLIQSIVPWLYEQQQYLQPPLIPVDEIKSRFKLNETEYNNSFHRFLKMKIWELRGNKLQLTNYLSELKDRFGLQNDHIDFHLLHRFSQEREISEMMKIVTMAASRKQAEDPTVTLKALVTLEEILLKAAFIESVGIPWFKILEIINQDPNSIYQIDPFKWEEIIAGAYEAAGFRGYKAGFPALGQSRLSGHGLTRFAHDI